MLVPPGAVPETSSGKLRRSACKQAYENGDLSVLARADEQVYSSGCGSDGGDFSGNGPVREKAV